MIGAFLFGINDLFGDPIGAIAEASADAARAERRRQESLPSNRLAAEKIRLYDSLIFYEEQLIFWKGLLEEFPYSREDNQKMVDRYQKEVDDRKERLKLL